MNALPQFRAVPRLPLMHRTLNRSLSAFLAIWFLLVMLGPEAVHSCPVHSSVSGAHSGHGSGVSAEHNMAAHNVEHIPAPETLDKGCNCPGDCAATSLAALKAPTTTVPVPPAVLRVRTTAYVKSAAAPHPDFVLPFAIGPPAPTAA